MKTDYYVTIPKEDYERMKSADDIMSNKKENKNAIMIEAVTTWSTQEDKDDVMETTRKYILLTDNKKENLIKNKISELENRVAEQSDIILNKMNFISHLEYQIRTYKNMTIMEFFKNKHRGNK